MEYESAIKEEIMQFAAIELDLESMLNKESQEGAKEIVQQAL